MKTKIISREDLIRATLFELERMDATRLARVLCLVFDAKFSPIGSCSGEKFCMNMGETTNPLLQCKPVEEVDARAKEIIRQASKSNSLAKCVLALSQQGIDLPMSLIQTEMGNHAEHH